MSHSDISTSKGKCTACAWYLEGSLCEHWKVGPKRNRKMLELKPDGVVAFPGGRGTMDMIRAATEAGVPVWHPEC